MTGSSLRGAGSDRFSGALPRLSYRTFKPLEGVEPSPPWFVARAPDPPAGALKLRGGVEPPRLASEAGVRIHRTERELQEGVEPSTSPVPGECSTETELLQRDGPCGIRTRVSGLQGRHPPELDEEPDGPTESRTRISALRTLRSPIDL